METIHAEDIRKVMEGYGESLPDLGAKYAAAFQKWYSQREPEVYKAWLEGYEKPLDPKLLAETLLFDFSNNTLDGRVHDRHDSLLVEFCNANTSANKHISGLLKKLSK